MQKEQSRDLVEPVPTLKVVEMNPQTDPRWEALVNSLHGSIYHHPAWLQVIEEAYGYKPVHLACEDESGQLRGVLPLFYQRGLLTGRRFSSLPHTPIAGPLASDEEALAALVQAAIDRTNRVPRAQLQLKMASNELEGLVDGVVGVSTNVTYLLELPAHPDLLRLDSRIKRAVNKASRLGMQVRPAETEREFWAWYDLYLETMRRLAIPPRPYRFFEILWKRLHPCGIAQLLLAEPWGAGQSKLSGGLLYLRFSQTLSYAFAGWRREDQLLRPNDAIHWRAIHDACADGFRFCDFGEESKNNSGLARYKSKWGAKPKLLYRYYYPVPRDLAISALDSSSIGHRLVRTLWSRLPMKATVLLSEMAHRYL